MVSLRNVGFVAIGRNEGARLESSLTAIKRLCPASYVVYVDSGSTDNSVAFANGLGCDVVELDMSIPFTAARARNAGFEQLLNKNGQIECVQFLDGDCELQPGWIEAALDFLRNNTSYGICSGRRLEKYAGQAIYADLMDMEWNTPVGETMAVLGDMLVRVDVFNKVNGFDETIIAAEDDDFCLRVRAAGSGIYRLDQLMSIHDANITSIFQWYRRSKRGGHGYANINHIHGGAPEFYFRRQLTSVVLYGGLVPFLFLSLLLIKPVFSLCILILYLGVIAKLGVKKSINGEPVKVSFYYSFLIYTGKVAEFFGAIEYWKNKILSRKHYLIEYK